MSLKASLSILKFLQTFKAFGIYTVGDPAHGSFDFSLSGSVFDANQLCQDTVTQINSCQPWWPLPIIGQSRLFEIVSSSGSGAFTLDLLSTSRITFAERKSDDPMSYNVDDVTFVSDTAMTFLLLTTDLLGLPAPSYLACFLVTSLSTPPGSPTSYLLSLLSSS